MCIIALQLEDSKILDDEVFDCCSSHNNDGFGIMWVENDELKIKKSLELKSIKEEYLRVKKEVKTPIVLHFRTSSKGEVSLDNCHPFYVSKNIGMAHNGTFSPSILTIPEDKDDYSDSRYFCECMLCPLAEENALLNETTITMLEQYIEYNKVVFLTNEKKYYILNRSSWDWDSSCNTWFSNSQYKKQVPLNQVTTYNKRNIYNSYDAFIECAECGRYLIRRKTVQIDTWKKTFYICFDCLKSNANQVNKYFSMGETNVL